MLWLPRLAFRRFLAYRGGPNHNRSIAKRFLRIQPKRAAVFTMTSPVGLKTVTVNIVPPDGISTTNFKVSAVSTVPLKWGATGDNIDMFITKTSGLGLTLPAVDQAGFVVRGRLWRRANPALPEAERQALVAALMDARRAVGRALRAGDAAALGEARAAVHAAKLGLGERGPVWWTDGAPDLNRHMAITTPYAAWFDTIDAS